jgi:phosphoesterase RecJ-like protein
LLTAIAMDTGWFRHSNTGPGTLRTVAELIESGGEIDRIYKDLFERNTLSRLKLMGTTLSNLRTDAGGRIAYATVTCEDLLQTGAIPPETEDLVDFTVSIAGVEVGLLFIEQYRGGIKLSIRSRGGLDCARLASAFGGGGHRAAAGAYLPDPLSESLERVLATVRQGINAAQPARLDEFTPRDDVTDSTLGE